MIREKFDATDYIPMSCDDTFGGELAWVCPLIPATILKIHLRRMGEAVHGGDDSDSFAGGTDEGPLPQLRPVGHHGAGLARCARRPQAGAAAHPLHDVPRPAPVVRGPAS